MREKLKPEDLRKVTNWKALQDTHRTILCERRILRALRTYGQFIKGSQARKIWEGEKRQICLKDSAMSLKWCVRLYISFTPLPFQSLLPSLFLLFLLSLDFPDSFSPFCNPTPKVCKCICLKFFVNEFYKISQGSLFKKKPSIQLERLMYLSGNE